MADLRSTQHSPAARSAAAAAVVALANGGSVRIYGGTRGDLGTLLWESPTFPTPAFGQPNDGVAVSLFDPLEAEVLVTGEASWYRVNGPDGGYLWDGSVGDPADGNRYNLEVEDVEFVQGGTFKLNSLTYTAERQGN